MPLAKMWAEEDVQNFVADIRKLAIEKLDEGMAEAREMHEKGALPFNPDELMKLRVQGATFAITHLELKMGDLGSEPNPKLGFVLHLQFGDSAPTWNSLIQMGLQTMEAQVGDRLIKKESKIGEVAMIAYSPNDASGIEMGLNLAMVPGGILVGTLQEDVRGIVESMQAKKAVLGATKQYEAMSSRLSTAGSECEMFLRMDPMIDFAMSGMRMAMEQGGMEGVDMDGIERAAKAMGLRDLGAMGAVSTYEDGKCISRAFAAHGGSATTTTHKTIDTAFLKWVPKDAVSFAAGTMDVMSIYETVMRGLEAYDPEFAKKAMAKLAEVEKKLGFSMREDLFGSLGDHYITWQMPMGSVSSLPELAFLMKVTDEAKLVSALKNLAKASNGMIEIEEGEKRGIKAYQIRINVEPGEQFGGMNPFAAVQPTFAFKGGYMVAGVSASDVKRWFQRMDREDDPKGDIRSSKEFAAIASTIPAGVDSLSFTDWKSNFESLYGIGTGLLAFVPISEEVPLDMSLLPDAATLTKHLFASVSYSKTDKAGTETVSSSPFGPELAVLFGGGVVAGLATFGVMRRGF
jgi:hypothetical protein